MRQEENQTTKRREIQEDAQGRRAFCAGIQCFLRDENGIGVVEIVLILVVLIGLVILFKNQLNSLMKTILNNIRGDALSI